MYNDNRTFSEENNLKKCVSLLLVAAVLFLLAACTLDPFEEYENFVMDMDINARIEDAMNGVEKGDTSPFFESSVKSIYFDLESFNEDDYRTGLINQPVQADYTAGNINNYYLDCVQLLLRAIEQNKAGNKQQAKLYYDQAIERYQGAQSLYAQFLAEYGRENNYNS